MVSYSPIARGVLTGKYDPDAPPPEGTRAARNDKRMMQTEWNPDALRVAKKIADHAKARGVTPGQFAVAWVLNNKLITGVVAGPRTEEQWDDYPGALNYRLTAEDEALVNDLVTTGHPAVAGLQRSGISDRGPRATELTCHCRARTLRPSFETRSCGPLLRMRVS